MNYLSFLTFCKDDNDYLIEWITYHNLIGVEKFYIVDNQSTTPIKEFLSDFIQSGLVEVYEYPQKMEQNAWIKYVNNLITEIGNKTKWLGYIDVDEFIVPKITDKIDTLLSDYEEFGGLSINWLMFGSSCKLKKDTSLLQIENFIACHDVNNQFHQNNNIFGINDNVKTIFQPQKLKSFNNGHNSFFIDRYDSVNENKEYLKNADIWFPHSSNLVQINHYSVRSLDEFKINRIKRGHVWLGNVYTYTNFFIANEFSTKINIDILRYAKLVREKLNMPPIKYNSDFIKKCRKKNINILCKYLIDFWDKSYQEFKSFFPDIRNNPLSQRDYLNWAYSDNAIGHDIDQDRLKKEQKSIEQYYIDIWS